MGSNTALRLRRSAAQLRALAQVEREIRASDPKGRCRYLRDYAAAFPAYESVLTDPQFGSMLATADVILVGDYHALPASQRYVTTLLARLPGETGRPLVLGLEAVFARHQHVLDEWMRGEIDECELRERLRFDLDWGYEWAPYRELLAAGRQHAQRIYGLDCTPRTDLRRIAARDRHAAAKIREIREQHPDAVLVVLFGESHLAPNHLPALLHERTEGALHLPAFGRCGRVLTILQNVDTLYWQAAGETCDRVEAVRVAHDVVCVFNSTPLDKYESYRLCLDRWRRLGGGAPDLAPSLYNLIDALAGFLNIDKYSPTNRVQPKFLVDLLPEVCFRPAGGQLERLLLRRGLAASEVARILEHVGERGACHVASVNAIFATSFRVEHGAEEAARFVHHACQGTLLRPPPSPRAPEDGFYARVLREALAYFGSRVLCPNRPPVRESDLYVLYALPPEAIEQQSVYPYREFMQMLDFLVQHKDYEAHHRHYRGVPQWIRRGLQYTGGKFDFVTDKLGRMLGTELYDAYLSGAVTKRFLRSLFMRPLNKPGAPRAAYYAIVRKVAGT